MGRISAGPRNNHRREAVVDRSRRISYATSGPQVFLFLYFFLSFFFATNDDAVLCFDEDSKMDEGEEEGERGRGYLRISRVGHFSTREIKITIYLKVFFFFFGKGERYEILRETSDDASRRGKELRLIKISTFYILFRLAGQHRKRTGNTELRFTGKRQCARIFKNGEKKKKMHSSFQFLNRRIKSFSDRLVYVILFEENERLLSRSFKAGKLMNLFVNSFDDNVGRKNEVNGDTMRVFLESRNHPSSSRSSAVKLSGCNLMNYRTPRY